MQPHERPQISSNHPSVHGAAMALVDECEAFLHGTFAEILVSLDAPVPAWAVLNRLAHASLDEIFLIEAGLVSRPLWFDAEQELARELLDLAGNDGERVRRLQRSALVPLELWLAGKGRSTELGADAVLALASESLVELAGGL